MCFCHVRRVSLKYFYKQPTIIWEICMRIYNTFPRSIWREWPSVRSPTLTFARKFSRFYSNYPANSTIAARERAHAVDVNIYRAPSTTKFHNERRVKRFSAGRYAERNRNYTALIKRSCTRKEERTFILLFLFFSDIFRIPGASRNFHFPRRSCAVFAGIIARQAIRPRTRGDKC